MVEMLDLNRLTFVLFQCARLHAVPMGALMEIGTSVATRIVLAVALSPAQIVTALHV